MCRIALALRRRVIASVAADLSVRDGPVVESLNTSSNFEPAAVERSGRVERRELYPRVLGRLGDPRRGASLICVGGVHGNEPAGVLALQRILATLGSESDNLEGCLLALTGNRQALAERRRFIDRDLNRIWRRSELQRVRESGSLEAVEDREMQELDGEIREALAEAGERTFLLDIHTTSGPGPAFVVYEDTLVNRSFALEFPVTLVLGIEEELAGTLTTRFAAHGVTTVGFEAGQHDEEAAVDRAEAAIWIALEAAGIIRQGRRETELARRRFEAERQDVPHVVEVRYRHPIIGGDGFRMEPGFVSFQTIDKGELMATDVRGPIRAPESGRVLMPLYQSQGEDGFFIVRPILPLWLRLSSSARRLRLERIAHLLPGVRRDPVEHEAFEVDTRLARWLTLEFFHLLGFRRVAQDERWLRMKRRRFDD
jgi:succinylglutamate desuccinylase